MTESEMGIWTQFAILCGFIAFVGLGCAFLGTYLDNKQKRNDN